MKKALIILVAVLSVFLLFSCKDKPLHGHEWVVKEEIKKASCNEEGEAIYRCSCGEEKTDIVEKLGHSIAEIITESTYLKEGRVDYVCSLCGDDTLKKPFILAKLDIVGMGGETTYTLGSEDYYGAYAFLPNNEFYTVEGKLVASADGEPIALDQLIRVYVIKENVAEDGTVSYVLSINGFDYDIREDEGSLFVDFSGNLREVELKPNFHVHTGEIENFVSPDTPQTYEDPCQYFMCKDDCTLTIDEKEYPVQVIVRSGHLFKKGKCIYCGAAESSSTP